MIIGMLKNWVLLPTYVGIGTFVFWGRAAANCLRPSGGCLTAAIGISSTIISAYSK
jgi:hypothetical protein